MSGEPGVLLLAALEVERREIARDAEALVMDEEKADDAVATEFGELRIRASRYRWTRAWLESLGVPASE